MSGYFTVNDTKVKFVFYVIEIVRYYCFGVFYAYRYTHDEVTMFTI